MAAGNSTDIRASGKQLGRNLRRPPLLHFRHDGPEQERPTGSRADTENDTKQDLSTARLLEDWARTLDVPYWADLRDRTADPNFVERVPIGFARRHTMLAFAGEPAELPDSAIALAISSPENWPQVDVISRFLKRTVHPVFAPEQEILAAVNRAYQQRSGVAASLVEVFDDEDTIEDLESFAGREDLLDLEGSPPIIRLVNSILFEAVKARASDVHVQPLEEAIVVRQRIDGILFDVLRIPNNCRDEVISRLKILGRMNIAEKRLPQDGRATVQFGDRLVDLRIASLPTSFGERVVVRFLDKSSRLLTLDELGMSPGRLRLFRALIKRDHGILLATGPTGGGKSTTLYAALQEVNCKDLNVLTLEDPIEYQLEGISQTQVNYKKGLTFASGLRSVLRQDPDIIMVGEIRDRETAVMAIQSALTGHLVFSTLHTNDAASAVTRLLDLGIEPYLLASSLIGVVAQRLVRKICPGCRQPTSIHADDLVARGFEPERFSGRTLYRGRGCTDCRETGYFGRVGIFEVLPVSDTIRESIQSRANAAQIRSLAIGQRVTLLREDGLEKVAAGTTTLEEILRVTTYD